MIRGLARVHFGRSERRETFVVRHDDTSMPPLTKRFVSGQVTRTSLCYRYHIRFPRPRNAFLFTAAQNPATLKLANRDPGYMISIRVSATHNLSQRNISIRRSSRNHHAKCKRLTKSLLKISSRGLTARDQNTTFPHRPRRININARSEEFKRQTGHFPLHKLGKKNDGIETLNFSLSSTAY